MAEGSADGMGNLELVATGSVDVPGRLQQLTPAETALSRDTATSDWKALVMPTTVVGHLDRVIEGGRTFEVTGAPYPVQTPAGTDHIELQLRLLEG